MALLFTRRGRQVVSETGAIEEQSRPRAASGELSQSQMISQKCRPMGSQDSEGASWPKQNGSPATVKLLPLTTGYNGAK